MLYLTNGSILDGSGGPAFPGGVLISGDRIEAVGQIDPPADCETIDCGGQAIAPGFIDIHSHSDLQVLDGYRTKTSQGVTTEVVGNCGFSPYPSFEDRDPVRKYADGILFGSGEWGWRNAGDYLAAASERASSTNVVSLIGHGSLRVAFMGERQEPATARELDAMAGCLDEALAQGAAGFSTGLMYAPGSCATREDLVGLLKVVARRGKVHATHMRSYSWDLHASIEEQLSLARESGCRLQISHLQAVGRKNWHKQDLALEMLDRARDSGLDVEFDSYPYLAGSTVATQLLPQSALDGGIPSLLSALADPETRARLAQQTEAGLAQEWTDVLVTGLESETNQRLVGKSFAAVGEEWSTTPVEALFRLLELEKGKVNILSFNQSEENLRKLLTHRLCTVISDGFNVKGRPHPRLYGTFPELLGVVCRDKGWIELAAAIHKITAKPAGRMNLSGRGLLRRGFSADVTVFDPGAIRPRATYENPRMTPEGIRIVILGGILLQEN